MNTEMNTETKDYIGNYTGDIYGCCDQECKQCVKCNPLLWWLNRRPIKRPDMAIKACAEIKKYDNKHSNAYINGFNDGFIDKDYNLITTNKMNSTTIDEQFNTFIKEEVKNGNGEQVKQLLGELDKLKQGKTPSILDNMTIDGLDENGKREMWNASVEFNNQLQAEYGEQYFNNTDEVMRRTREFQANYIKNKNNPKCDNCGKQCECSYGHNAIPLLEAGKRVCDKCNALVIKKRINQNLRDGGVEKIGKVITLTHEEWIQREAELCAKWKKKKQLQNEQIKKKMIENFTKRTPEQMLHFELQNVWKVVEITKAENLAIELFRKKIKSFTPTRVFEKDAQHFRRICNEVANELQNERVEKQKHTINELLFAEEVNTKKQIKKDLKKQSAPKKKNICSCGNKNCEPRPPKERFTPAGIKINTKPLQEAWDRKHGKIPPPLQKI
jgi:hypothetical protein